MKYNRIICALIISNFLISRGMDIVDKCECFQSESYFYLESPELLKARRRAELRLDMQKRLEEEKKCLNEFEKKQQKKVYQKINDIFKRLYKQGIRLYNSGQRYDVSIFDNVS